MDDNTGTHAPLRSAAAVLSDAAYTKIPATTAEQCVTELIEFLATCQ